MKFNYNTGGKPSPAVSQAGGSNDCVTRALAIATGLNYSDVYGDVLKFAPFCDSEGVNILGAPFIEYAERLGFVYVPKPYRQIPMRGLFAKFTGTFLVHTQNHLSALVDGVLNDTFDVSNAYVKGYFVKKSSLYELANLDGEVFTRNPLNYSQAISMYHNHARNFRKNSVLIPCEPKK